MDRLREAVVVCVIDHGAQGANRAGRNPRTTNGPRLGAAVDDQLRHTNNLGGSHDTRFPG